MERAAFNPNEPPGKSHPKARLVSDPPPHFLRMQAGDVAGSHRPDFLFCCLRVFSENRTELFSTYSKTSPGVVTH